MELILMHTLYFGTLQFIDAFWIQKKYGFLRMTKC